MKITATSALRNAASYIQRYCDQMDALQTQLASRGASLRLILGYGDSNDGTDALIFASCMNRFDYSLIDVSHGGPSYASVVDAQRWRQLAFIWNMIWTHIPQDSQLVLFVEADLIWQADTMMALIDDLTELPKRAAVAPMVMMRDGRFYDTWAFRQAGRQFSNYPPFHPALAGAQGLLQLDSAGSVLLIEGTLARQCSWPEEDVVVGLCRQIYDHGAAIFLDVAQKVFHP